MKPISNFNERFKEAFGNRNLTEFANELGVSKQTISAYLNGKRKPKPIVSAQIAKKLNVSPAWLLGFDVSKEPEDTSNMTEQDIRTTEFIQLFSKLNADQQKLIIAQIRGILASQSSDDASEPTQKIWLAASSSDDQAPAIVEVSKAKVKAAQDDHSLKNEEDL